MPEIRRDVGICMQHDCLFPKLTVREHVEFFSRLKGVYNEFTWSEAEKHVDQAIEDVALSEKRHTFSCNLSGGMKRKLSVAVAFCGGSKVVVLDEPTSGMDPFSRRFTWNVIRHYRHNRIIILTTHFMDEADILGDRIAIMADGQLRCAGSSLFLKKIYGVGYQLTIEKNQVLGHPPHGGVSRNVRRKARRELPNIDESDDGSIEVSEDNSGGGGGGGHQQGGAYALNVAPAQSTRVLKRIVMDSVSEAKLIGDVGSELRYQLPLGSSSRFKQMFERLDDEVERGSVSCYGVSITTLDEVFLIVTKGELPEKQAFASSRHGSAEFVQSEEETDASCHSSITKLDEEGLFSRHLHALLKKRAAIFRRDKKAWVFTTILPSLFVFFGFLLASFVAPVRNLVPLRLDIRDFNVDVESPNVQNPIAVNSPNNPFTCQVPTCSNKKPYVQEDLTNETYFYCGFQAKLGLTLNGFTPTNSTCSISLSTDIMSTIAEGGASAAEASVTNITEVRRFFVLQPASARCTC